MKAAGHSQMVALSWLVILVTGVIDRKIIISNVYTSPRNYTRSEWRTNARGEVVNKKDEGKGRAGEEVSRRGAMHTLKTSSDCDWAVRNSFESGPYLLTYNFWNEHK